MAVIISGDTGIDAVQDNTIQTSDIADNQITGAKILNGEITEAKLSAGAGSADQVLTSNGSGTLAWVDASGGIWEQVESVTFSTTGFWNWRPDLYASRSDYKLFKIIFDKIIPVSDGAEFGYQWMNSGTLSSANATGTAWYATSVNGAYPGMAPNGKGSGSGYYYPFYQVGSDTAEYGVCSEINCYNFQSNTGSVMIYGSGVWCDPSARGNAATFCLINRGTNTVNGIRFIFSTNDIESGTARVLGLKV